MAEQSEHPKKVHMLEALSKTLGVVTPALEKANVGRTTYYDWLKADQQFLHDVKAIEDICLSHDSQKCLYSCLVLSSL